MPSDTSNEGGAAPSRIPFATSTVEPRAQLDAREAQALGLGVERGALGLPLGGELILEVVEEAIPAHPARLGQRSRHRSRVIHSGGSGFLGVRCDVLYFSDRHPPVSR